MGIGAFFRALFGGEPPGAAMAAHGNVIFSRVGARGKGGASHKRVAVITMSQDLRLYLAKDLKLPIRKMGYDYDDHPSIDKAVGSQVVMMEVLPKADAQLHGSYDKIVRMKKGMNKTDDVLCMIGLRDNYSRYPRGTYPGLLYFCMKPDEPDYRDPELSLEGLQTIEGPLLYNFADLPGVILSKVKELSRG